MEGEVRCESSSSDLKNFFSYWDETKTIMQKRGLPVIANSLMEVALEIHTLFSLSVGVLTQVLGLGEGTRERRMCSFSHQCEGRLVKCIRREEGMNPSNKWPDQLLAKKLSSEFKSIFQFYLAFANSNICSVITEA